MKFWALLSGCRLWKELLKKRNRLQPGNIKPVCPSLHSRLYVNFPFYLSMHYDSKRGTLVKIWTGVFVSFLVGSKFDKM